jgi:protein CpxP
MKKLLLLCTFVMGISAVSFAQKPTQTPETSLEQLKTQVTGITDAQGTKIKAVYTVSLKSQDSLRTALGMSAGGGGGDFKTFYKKLTPITDAANTKIKAVLTASQVTQFQKAIDARAERIKQIM